MIYYLYIIHVHVLCMHMQAKQGLTRYIGMLIISFLMTMCWESVWPTVLGPKENQLINCVLVNLWYARYHTSSEYFCHSYFCSRIHKLPVIEDFITFSTFLVRQNELCTFPWCAAIRIQLTVWGKKDHWRTMRNKEQKEEDEMGGGRRGLKVMRAEN